MRSQNKTRRFAKLFGQYMPSATVFKCGLALLIICTVAAFVMAYYHDAYSSILELKVLAATDVWFKLFVILMVLGAALLVGSPLLAMVLAGITLLFPSKEPEVVEEQLAPETPVVKEETPTVEQIAPEGEQPERVIINEARLRTIFNSKFMNSWSDEPGKMYIDKVIEDLQFVRDNYRQGSKDRIHFADKHITEIAELLHKIKYFNEFTNSFTDWCCTLFDCLSLESPKRENIKKYQDFSDQVKKRFYYLL